MFISFLLILAFALTVALIRSSIELTEARNEAEDQRIHAKTWHDRYEECWCENVDWQKRIDVLEGKLNCSYKLCDSFIAKRDEAVAELRRVRNKMREIVS